MRMFRFPVLHLNLTEFSNHILVDSFSVLIEYKTLKRDMSGLGWSSYSMGVKNVVVWFHLLEVSR